MALNWIELTLQTTLGRTDSLCQSLQFLTVYKWQTPHTEGASLDTSSILCVA